MAVFIESRFCHITRFLKLCFSFWIYRNEMQNLPLKHWKNMNLKWERLSEVTNLVYKRFVPRRLSQVMLLKCQVSY